MRVVIVCPTPRGGHIEHAANLAAAFARTGDTVTLVSRPGAAGYLPAGAGELFRIAELLTPLRDAAGVRRVADRAAVLAAEHLAVRRLIRRSAEPTLVVVEEPRYPAPGLLRGGRGRVALVCFLHNVVEHAAHGGRQAPMDRLRAVVKKGSLHRYDALVVHGTRQVRTLGPALPAVGVALPAHGWVERAWRAEAGGRTPEAGGFLCLGQIRRNKGVHLAVAAAAHTCLPLLVAGEPVDPGYRAEITALAGDTVTVRDHFLTPVAFELALRAARAVLLPYVGFDAQSGVLARALAVGVRVIASDLPALREQAGGHPLVTFVPPGDIGALAAAMTGVAARPAPPTPETDELASDDDWNAVTDRIRAAAHDRLGRPG